MFSPAWASVPGDTIRDALSERSLSVSECAERLGATVEEFESLLTGQKEISRAIAQSLTKLIGGSQNFWLERERLYRLRIGNDGAALLTKQFPFHDARHLGWITDQPQDNNLLQTALRFFGVSTAAEWQRNYLLGPMGAAFRQSSSHESNAVAVLAWLRRGQLLAEKIECADWNPHAFRDAVTSARLLTRRKQPASFVSELRDLCAGAGVALVIARTPAGCPISGAARFIADAKACIQLSFRHLTDDQFWFSFFHEAGHLLLHEGADLFIDTEEADLDEFEREANKFAQDVIIPEGFKEAFATLRLNHDSISRFALRADIATGLVVGQLQHAKRVPFNHFHGLKRRYNEQDIQNLT